MDQAGTRLKKLRLEKGISLEEIQKKTRIHPNILRAIEGDAITNLSPVYLKSFLKIYCKFLGVDYHHYLSDYKMVESTPLPAAQRELAQKQQQQAAPSFIKAASLKVKSLRPNKTFNRIVIVSAAALFLLLGLFKAGKIIFSGRKTPAPVQSAKAEPPRKPAQKAKPAVSAQSASEIKLGIKANDNCWVALKVDGRIVFQRVLAKGRFESWKAKDKMELSLGNAGAVELEVNGKVFSNLGRKGQALKNIVITREGMNIAR